MPKQSRYSNTEFETAMQDIYDALEKNKADRELSLMLLGNVLSNIFNDSVEEVNRTAMVEQFCAILKKSTKGK